LASVIWAAGFGTALGLLGERFAPVTIGHAFCGMAIAGIGSALRIAAINRIGRGFSWGSAAPDELITDGIYARVKHPLVWGYAMQVMGLALSHPYGLRWSLAYLVTLFLCCVCASHQIAKEEAILRERFGDRWTEHARNKFF
jgi:protein-S-isoprenylcysteine O-methyltransferase Ste14